MAQEVLIKTLVENNLTGILYDTHEKQRFYENGFSEGFGAFRAGGRLYGIASLQHHPRCYEYLVSAQQNRIAYGVLQTKVNS